jgi:hypothetical protein
LAWTLGQIASSAPSGTIVPWRHRSRSPTALFGGNPARPRRHNLTPDTRRLTADDPTIVAQFYVQIRKTAINITMPAITATALFVGITNVRYVRSCTT